ncbi:response regulator [Streptomyces halobius]|uniref:Response regulator transcription factor n=1 Tax=Streptomyces halobius TaxID=2879846 RepID=A0ABY4MDP6_9ACTN|nr:response regulator transcription factor [Streptomyces halobius]UQA94436.1 response regulator transcription factor [Streptomyces halobius]
MTLILIVNDDPLLRAGLRMIIESANDLEAQIAGGAEALAEARRCRPDVVLLDIRMGATNGFALLKDLLELPNPPRVAVLSSPAAGKSVLTALRIGAAGCLLKDTGPEELLTSVRALAVGNTVLSTLAASLLMAELEEEVEHSDASLEARRMTASLSAREHEVLTMIAEGLSNADIGRRLTLGTGTVKDCVSDIFNKLGVVNRVQAAVIAYRARLPMGVPPTTSAA